MSDRYPVPAVEVRREDVIERSRFLTALAPVADEAAARAFLAGVRAEHPDATHHCHAWVIGPPGSTARVAMSDDGEPHGTAGRPMLNVLLHGGVGDIAAVVTRFYGGRKLGRGGLVRAYGGCVQAALADLETRERVEWVQLALSFGYGDVDAVRRLYPAHEVERLQERFADDVVDRVRVPRSREGDLRAAFRDLLRGRGRIDSG